VSSFCFIPNEIIRIKSTPASMRPAISVRVGIGLLDPQTLPRLPTLLQCVHVCRRNCRGDVLSGLENMVRMMMGFQHIKKFQPSRCQFLPFLVASCTVLR
jgi:hypothetical protein